MAWRAVGEGAGGGGGVGGGYTPRCTLGTPTSLHPRLSTLSSPLSTGPARLTTPGPPVPPRVDAPFAHGKPAEVFTRINERKPLPVEADDTARKGGGKSTHFSSCPWLILPIPPSRAIFHSCTGFRWRVSYTRTVPDFVPLARCVGPRRVRWVSERWWFGGRSARWLFGI